MTVNYSGMFKPKSIVKPSGSLTYTYDDALKMYICDTGTYRFALNNPPMVTVNDSLEELFIPSTMINKIISDTIEKYGPIEHKEEKTMPVKNPFNADILYTIVEPEPAKKRPESRYLPGKIIQRDRATIVNWNDGTETTIVLEEGKENGGMFEAFCIAFTKKMYGSTTNIMNAIENADYDAIEARKKKEREERKRRVEELVKREREAAEKAEFEAKVREAMLDQKAWEEAMRRMQIRAEKEYKKAQEQNKE